MESSGHVALTDFGLSKKLLPGERTSTFCGTAEYLAPEQLRRTAYDTSIDWCVAWCGMYVCVGGGLHICPILVNRP